MKIITIQPKGFACNSYILTQNGTDAVIIDCGQPRVYSECLRLGYVPKAVLLTHGHYDHIGGCGVFYQAGVPIYCGEGEQNLIFSNDNRAIFHDITIPPFQITKTLCGGEQISVCGMVFKVISTPGHTAGGVCYLVENTIFSGDTLFFDSVGRTDFQTSNYNDLVRSVQKLYALSGDYVVYCGHGQPTTLARERIYNPYIRQC